VSHLTKTLTDALGNVKDLERREGELRSSVEDLIFWHNTDAHPECPAHGSDGHGSECCAVRRAKATLNGIELKKWDQCRSSKR
jgi:hypothetical protein